MFGICSSVFGVSLASGCGDDSAFADSQDTSELGLSSDFSGSDTSAGCSSGNTSGKTSAGSSSGNVSSGTSEGASGDASSNASAGANSSSSATSASSGDSGGSGASGGFGSGVYNTYGIDSYGTSRTMSGYGLFWLDSGLLLLQNTDVRIRTTDYGEYFPVRCIKE